MAGRIQGITVEIGGDTTKLQTALKGVNTEIRNTQSQLRDVDKLLKLDPGNTELLAQKHRLLGDAVKETKEKLETLKTAAEQAEQALKDGTITQEQYDGLQREIVETEQKLKALEEQARQSGTALQEIAAKGEKLKTVGDNVTNVGKKFMPVTLGVVGLGTAAVKTAADFDSAMSKVAAVSGATGSDLEALRDKAREMGEKTKFSASEAAEAMNYMAMAGWKTEDMLSGIEGVMNLAAASGEDLATTSDIVTDALTAFGLTAKDSGHFADILAAASSNANTNVSMMGETFKYCAPIAGALGFSAEDTAEAIGLMANAGIKGSQAGTSLRTIMNNLSGDVTICGSAIGEVTIATTNADGSMRDLSDILADCRTAFSGLSESEKAAAAESLVGKNAMSGFLALMNAGEADINKLSSAIDNCDGSAASMAETMNDNLAGQLQILKSQLEELAISFGELLMPAIRTIVGWIQKFVDWLNSMDEGTRKVIVTIALVAAAIGPVLIIVGKVISAVGTIMTLVPKLAGVINAAKGVFAAFNAVCAANPYVLIIAAIVALVAAFIYLWNNCEEFRRFWIDLWESIKEIAIAVWEALKAFFQAAWEAIKTTATTVWNAIKDFFSFNAGDEVRQYQKIMREYRQEYGCDPSDRELCAFLYVSREKLDQIRKAAQMGQIRSLSEPVPGTDEEISLGDTVASGEDMEEETIREIDKERMKRELWLAVDQLPGNLPAAVRLRYADRLTLEKTGQALGVNRERVRQLESKAFRILRQPHRCRKFRAYFEEYLSAAPIHHVGVRRFNETWTSEVEQETFRWAEKELGYI